MIEEAIRDKLYNSVSLIKLSTGESLIGMAFSKVEGNLMVCFPHLLNDTETIEYCVESASRIFQMNLMHVVYVQKVNSKLVENFFREVIASRSTEFRKFIIDYTKALIPEQHDDNVDVTATPEITYH